MRTVLTPLAVLLLVALPLSQSTATAGRLVLRLADLVSDARTIVVGEVVALRDVAGETVAEVRVVDLLKGELPGDTLFYSARPFSWDPGEPKVGEWALLLLDSGEAFQGTRAFWKALDRLRAGRPFRPLALGGYGRMPMIRRAEGGDPVVHPRRDPAAGRAGMGPRGSGLRVTPTPRGRGVARRGGAEALPVNGPSPGPSRSKARDCGRLPRATRVSRGSGL